MRLLSVALVVFLVAGEAGAVKRDCEPGLAQKGPGAKVSHFNLWRRTSSWAKEALPFAKRQIEAFYQVSAKGYDRTTARIPTDAAWVEDAIPLIFDNVNSYRVYDGSPESIVAKSPSQHVLFPIFCVDGKVAAIEMRSSGDGIWTLSGFRPPQNDIWFDQLIKMRAQNMALTNSSGEKYFIWSFVPLLPERDSREFKGAFLLGRQSDSSFQVESLLNQIETELPARQWVDASQFLMNLMFWLQGPSENGAN